MAKTNFFEYLGFEEHNHLISYQRLGALFGRFGELESIYLKPLDRLNISDRNEQVIGLLYLFVHYHLYFSISCILRCHLSESFASSRKALDAALTAYRIIQKPETAQDYLNRDNKFIFIQQTIRNESKENPKLYPLAEPLLNVHGIFSRYGSHADINSFFHRFQSKADESGKGGEMTVQYFQIPKDDKEFKYWFLYTLTIYYSMFAIFKTWLDAKFRIIDPSWESSISTFRSDILNLTQAHQISNTD